jgi:D-threo-aldose 1-dehydrogenase
VRRITLPGTTLETSALGFGTVGGGLSRARRLDLYERAFAAGITHFDTARSYGLGGAERTLAAFVKGKRDRVTLTTKLGIQPPRANAFLGLARRFARGVERVLPALGAAAKQRAAGMMTVTRRFSVEEARASFETSLRELNTDYVDILLLHECSADDVHPDLVEYLERCVLSGKLRYSGIATSRQASSEIVKPGGVFPQVVQIAGGIAAPLEATLPINDRAVITHSMFDRLGELQRLLEDPVLRRTLSDGSGLDLTGGVSIASLFVQYALHANPRGIVLFSSTNPHHIEANVGTLEHTRLDADRLEAFGGIARRLLSAQ